MKNWYGVRVFGSVESSKMVGGFKTYEELVEYFQSVVLTKDFAWDYEDDFLLVVNLVTKETHIKYFEREGVKSESTSL